MIQTSERKVRDERRCARRGSARRALRWLPAAVASVAGCAAVDAVRDQAPAAGAVVDDRLPPGRGRSILEAECTGCHNLGGLWAYQGYYTRERWRGLVETMIAHGANLDETATNELVDYLAEHFGPGSR